LSIGARVSSIKMEDVQDALWMQRTIVKTWCMRGTLHLLASSDLPLYVAASKSRLGYRDDKLFKQYGISGNEIERITAGIHKALDGCCLTREELASKLARQIKLNPKTRRVLVSGWGSLLQPAALQGVLCFGPSQGPKVTFVRADQWLGKGVDPRENSEEALKTLLRRFLAAYGPITYQEFGHWWGGPPQMAQELMSSISEELDQVEFEGHRAWVRKADAEQILRTPLTQSIRLLPSWDCYVMFYHPRGFLVPWNFRPGVFRQLQGNAPVLLLDGAVAGVWERRQKGRQIELRVEPFVRLNLSDQNRVNEEAIGLGEFLGAPVEVTFTKVASPQ